MQISIDDLDAIRDDSEIRKIIGENLITVKGTIEKIYSPRSFGTIKADNDLPNIVLHIT